MTRTVDIDALVATVASENPISAGASIVPAIPREGLSDRLEIMLAEIGKLTINQTVGVGGRGIVRSAAQAGLRRDVAVKTVRGERSDEAIVELLQEALITGSLEHPNIVPVHYIGVGDDGAPFIVLKKIEGRTWNEVLAGDSLEANLKILLEVIDAVRFAHSRGIIHRDLKPANVMVGEFGEVYVLDWGLAVSLDDGADWLPRASEVHGVAGTLGYMAPEMLTGGALTERTDVYLLGAVLYEIACGRPPHRGPRVSALFESIVASSPPIDDATPAELAAIIRRAMSADPGDRHASATELKEAIEAFAVHREAARLTDGAAARLDALLEACAAEQPDSDALYNVFGECRFGFREAMRRWPEGAAARAGLDRAVTAMVEHELVRGEAAAAERLLAELSAPPPALRERVDGALAERRGKLETLEKLEADLDPSTGSGTRVLGAAALGAITIAAFLATPLLRPDLLARPSWKQFFIVIMAAGAALGIVGLLLRRTLMASLPNRLFTLAVVVAWVATVTVVLGNWRAGVDPEIIQSFHPIIWLSCFSMLVGAVDRRLWPTSVVLIGVALVIPSTDTSVNLPLLASTLAFIVVNISYVSIHRAREACED